MNRTNPNSEQLSFAPWTRTTPPEKVLVVRFHALGDVALTLPSCFALRELFPRTQIDFLTTAAGADLLSAVDLFGSIHTFAKSETSLARVGEGARTGARLRREGYTVVVDLQRNWVTRLIRRMISSEAWGEIDRFSPVPAGERVAEVFRRLGFTGITPAARITVKRAFKKRARELLAEEGWGGNKKLAVLNPAGLWETRNWPLSNYLQLARLWLAAEDVVFLLLGTNRILEKASYLSEHLEGSVINLVGKTTAAEALAILQHIDLVISEDSGLMHMAWVSGIPTVALFGSSRHDWSRPLGDHTRCLHSGDLPCGACMEPTCRFHDVHCLTRYTPEYVFRVAQEVMLKAPSGAARRLPAAGEPHNKAFVPSIL